MGLCREQHWVLHTQHIKKRLLNAHFGNRHQICGVNLQSLDESQIAECLITLLNLLCLFRFSVFWAFESVQTHSVVTFPFQYNSSFWNWNWTQNSFVWMALQCLPKLSQWNPLILSYSASLWENCIWEGRLISIAPNWTPNLKFYLSLHDVIRITQAQSHTNPHTHLLIIKHCEEPKTHWPVSAFSSRNLRVCFWMATAADGQSND